MRTAALAFLRNHARTLCGYWSRYSDEPLGHYTKQRKHLHTGGTFCTFAAASTLTSVPMTSCLGSKGMRAC